MGIGHARLRQSHVAHVAGGVKTFLERSPDKKPSSGSVTSFNGKTPLKLVKEMTDGHQILESEPQFAPRSNCGGRILACEFWL